MELRDYWKLFVKRLWLIVALMVIAGGGAAYYSYRQAPQYQTTTTLFLNPAASPLLPFQSAETVQSLANTYAEFMRTRSFGHLVVQQIGSSLDEASILNALSTEYIPSTRFFRITAVSGDPALAQVIANSAAQVLIAENIARQQAEQQQVDAQRSLNQDPERQRLMELRAMLQGEVISYADRIAYLQTQIAELRRIPRSTEIDRRSAELQTELSNMQMSRLNALSGLAQTQAALMSNGSRATSSVDTAVVVDSAPLPGAPLPRGLAGKVVQALAAALVLGCALAFLLEYLDYTIRTPEELDDVYAMPTRGVIGLVVRKRMQKPSVPPLVALHAPLAPASEAFRALRTSIQVSSLSASIRSLLVTSAGPGEGKTFVAANLAVSMAQNGSRVILVDADLRKPSLHSVFQLPREPGFTNLVFSQELDSMASIRPRLQLLYERASNREALRARYQGRSLHDRRLHVTFEQIEEFLNDLETDDAEALVCVAELRRRLDELARQDDPTLFLQRTGVENLSLLACGVVAPNPAELLGSSRAARVMEALADHADIVIYDSPPAATVTDATVLATRVDGVLQIVCAGKTRIDLVRRCKAVLDQVGANILGPVLNQTRPSDLGYYAYYYSYGSYHNGDQGGNGRSSAPDLPPRRASTPPAPPATVWQVSPEQPEPGTPGENDALLTPELLRIR